MNKISLANYAPKSNFSKFIPLLFLLIAFTGCSVPGMMNPDSYGRQHQVYAVDFNPENLGSILISKMDEGTYKDSEKVINNVNARFSISLKDNYLIVQANKASMDLPTYQTWLNYAMQELGYTMDSEYDVFDTVEEGWIYEINLEQFPMVEGDTHRILMYELK
jgi:ABC-type Fe3+-citrate transport system substrate-binding protein